MLKKSTSSLSAQKLRLVLIGGIFVLIAVAAITFYFARNVLAGYVADVQKVTDSAESSSKNLSALNTLRTILAEDKEAVDRAKNLVAESRSYAYQDQIIKDINTFAAKSGVSIAGYQFNESTASGAAGGSTAPTTPPASGTAVAPTVSGLKTVSVSVNLKSPLAYTDIMDFIHMIEQNLTKMQLAGISMNKDASSNNVTVSSLTIEVYVR